MERHKKITKRKKDSFIYGIVQLRFFLEKINRHFKKPLHVVPHAVQWFDNVPHVLKRV